jgi:hypothetical protein
MVPCSVSVTADGGWPPKFPWPPPEFLLAGAAGWVALEAVRVDATYYLHLGSTMPGCGLGGVGTWPTSISSNSLLSIASNTARNSAIISSSSP